MAAGYAARREAGGVEGREQVPVLLGADVVVLVDEGGPRRIRREGDQHRGRDQGLDPPPVLAQGGDIGAAARTSERDRGRRRRVGLYRRHPSSSARSQLASLPVPPAPAGHPHPPTRVRRPPGDSAPIFPSRGCSTATLEVWGRSGTQPRFASRRAEPDRTVGRRLTLMPPTHDSVLDVIPPDP